MTGDCEYVFDPDDEGGNRSKTSLDSAWECPHPAHAEADRCVFHLDGESRAGMGVSDEEVRNAFVRTLEGAEPGEACRFIGANFGETVVEADSLGRNVDAIDLRNATFEGKFELNCDTVESDLILNYSELEIFDASSTIFKGDLSFRGCSFEGKINLDSSRFEGRVSLEKASFDLGAEFSEGVFEKEVSFRLSKQKGARTNFKQAVFRDNVRVSRVDYDKADFTRAKFHSNADFSGANFNKETKFQYSVFNGSVDFGNSDFNGNSVFRGAKFAGKASFDDVSFQGWTSFAEVEFNSDASFEGAWFKSEINLTAASDNDAVLNFTGARMGKGSFEMDQGRSVVLDFTRARVGDLGISVDGRNALDNVRFVETEFNGFRFSEYADHLADKKYVIHDSVVERDEELSPARLEKTYGLAAEGAREEAKKIASKFAKKEAKYRRKKYRQEGKILRYLLDFLPF